MRPNLAAAIVAVGLCLLVAGVAQTAVTGQWRVQLIRGSTTVAQGVGATEAAAWADCESKIPRTATAPTVYACQTMRYYATVTPDPVPPTPPPSAGTARVWWDPPTQMTDIVGYRIHYGLSPGELTQTAQLADSGAREYRVEGLASGVWYFGVRTYRADGTQSVLSNVVSKTVQ